MPAPLMSPRPANPARRVQEAKAANATPAAPEPLPPLRAGSGPLPGPQAAPGQPIVNRVGDGFNPMTPVPVGPAVPGGTTITSTAGDGFGSPPGAGPGPRPRPVAPTPALPPSMPSVPAPRGVSLTPTNPASPLTTQTIGAGSLADRFQLAQHEWENFARASDPTYQASLRDASRAAAAGGGLGSGMLRTSVGDLASNRALALDTQRNTLLGNALEGTIGDAWRAVEQATQQQGFQAGQQQQAFDNELRRLGLTDQLTNADFQRALQTWMAGNQGGTGANTALAGASAARGNSNDALDALQAWMSARAAAPPAPAPRPQASDPLPVLRPLPTATNNRAGAPPRRGG